MLKDQVRGGLFSAASEERESPRDSCSSMQVDANCSLHSWCGCSRTSYETCHC
jgi:hypothetical protein